MGTYGSREPEPRQPTSEQDARDASDRELGLGLQTIDEAQESERIGQLGSEPPGHRYSPTMQEMRRVIDHLLALPTDAQLGVLRTCAPQIIASLDAHSRDGFMRDLNEEIERAIAGGEPYDVRPDAEH